MYPYDHSRVPLATVPATDYINASLVSVEAVDPVFQAKMLDMLKQTGRPEMVVGWYHSHPGFGCWLSGVDINTQQSFEALSDRAVAVVVDPIQSVKRGRLPASPLTSPIFPLPFINPPSNNLS